jgi:hypothetical protein
VRSLVVLPGPTGPRREGRFYPWWNRGRFEIRGGLTVLRGRRTECAALLACLRWRGSGRAGRWCCAAARASLKPAVSSLRERSDRATRSRRPVETPRSARGCSSARAPSSTTYNKVFTKLEISSRSQLDQALPSEEREALPVLREGLVTSARDPVVSPVESIERGGYFGHRRADQLRATHQASLS